LNQNGSMLKRNACRQTSPATARGSPQGSAPGWHVSVRSSATAGATPTGRSGRGEILWTMPQPWKLAPS